jgi:hypothetical protein
VNVKEDFRLNDLVEEAIILNPLSLNGSSIGLWEFGTNRIPLLFLISYSNFKDLLSPFISSIINDGDIAEPERI